MNTMNVDEIRRNGQGRGGGAEAPARRGRVLVPGS